MVEDIHKLAASKSGIDSLVSESSQKLNFRTQFRAVSGCGNKTIPFFFTVNEANGWQINKIKKILLLKFIN